MGGRGSPRSSPANLFRAREGLTLKATRRPEGIEEAESAVLTTEDHEHRFFQERANATAALVPRGGGILLLLLVAAALGWRYGAGARPPPSATSRAG
jgi:hypothetical protein